MPSKLKAAQVKSTRTSLRLQQGLRCALCQLPLTEEKAVLDHDHKHGHIRGALHRGCNSLLGKVENNAARYGVDITAFSQHLGQYLKLHASNQTGLLHPSFFTPEEKILRARKKAKAKRLAKRTRQ